MIYDVKASDFDEYIGRVKQINGGQPKMAYVFTFGCQQNEADSEKIVGMAKAMGYGVCDNPDDADMIILNTCAIRQHAEEKALSMLGRFKSLKKKNSELIIGVCGCMAAEEHVKELLKNDPNYLANLASLPEAQKNALLYGDWNTFEGQVFTEWRNNPDGYTSRRNTHVIAPFKIPSSWKIYRGFDFGYSRPFSVGWYGVDHDGRLYRIRELYGCTGTPNEGVRWEPAEIARQIKRIEKEDINLKGRYINGIADPSIFDESRGESVGVMMERQGVFFEKADNTRIAGKMQLHNRLAFDENGVPMLYIFSTCKHFIRTIPSLVYSQVDVEDIDTTQEDHIYDEVRYIAMANPINPPKRECPVKIYNPLEVDSYGEYNFYR